MDTTNRIIAIIDLGTNTFHLMLAEILGDRRRIISRERVAVKIGMGGINDGKITESGIQRAIVTMKQFKTTIDAYNVSDIFAFGTSALRNARNGQEVADLLTKESGIPVKIISGEEEAGFIYAGVREAVQMGNETSIVVDIGGGSVEFIIGNNLRIFWKHSFEIGAQRLLERFQKNDPILPEEVDQLTCYLSDELAPLKDKLNDFNPTTLIGSSGTFDTLSEIYYHQQNIPYNEELPETKLTIESFYKTFQLLKTSTRARRLKIPGMIEMRVDMIVVACCVIDYILKLHTFKDIRVSTYSLKEGVLAGMK